jgi:wyosine [tRNA(Phe)-imidazoG37] synthetase (radical SAM superfamily)
MARILPLQKGIIYGPVGSRRLGRSLGINLSPTVRKVCSFNCVYCHYGWTKDLSRDLSAQAALLPAPEAVERELEAALKVLDPPPEYITFSGNGEPTLHPDFEEIVDRVVAVRDRYGPGPQVAVLSNSTALGNESVLRALARLDVRIMKLDAGTDEVLGRINRPAAGIGVGEIVRGLRKVAGVTLQSVFVEGGVSNTADEEIEAWLERVEEVAPAAVQIYSLENAPAMSTLTPVSRRRLEGIAVRVEERIGIRPGIY